MTEPRVSPAEPPRIVTVKKAHTRLAHPPNMFLHVLVLCLGVGAESAANEPVVVVPGRGTFKGKMETTESGLDYMAFTRIPYAKAPVGSLRFKVKNSCIVFVYVSVAEESERLREKEGIKVFFSSFSG